MTLRRSAAASTLTFLLGSALVGCSEEEAAPGEEPSAGPVQEGGPLEPPSAEGGIGIYRPRAAKQTWSGSFGGLPLCGDPADADLRISGVNVLVSEGVVENVEAYIAQRNADAQGDLLFLSAQGRAPTFTEPYATTGPDAQYTYKTLEDPVAVDGTCGEVGDAANLVLTFDTGTTGGAIEAWEVLYESDGQQYTTGPVPWEMWLCGDALAPRFACE